MPDFEDPMVRPRYTGLATFMRAPYCEDLQGVDIGLIGVPFDGGVTNRTGTRLDPEQHETPPPIAPTASPPTVTSPR